MPEKKMNDLAKALDIASKGYPEEKTRDYYEVDDEGYVSYNSKGHGDGLARFIVVEIMETFSDSVPFTTTLKTARNVVVNAIRDLARVARSLQKAYHSKVDDFIIPKEKIVEFIEKLDGEDGCNFRYKDGMPEVSENITWECGDGTQEGVFAISRRILKEIGISDDAAHDFLDYCSEWGGHCDCEIIFNVKNQLMSLVEPDDDELGEGVFL